MTRKKVTTTYRREFSPERTASRPSVIRSFDSNYNYREYRRQAEHNHHKSAFVWGDWEYVLEEEQWGDDRGGTSKPGDASDVEVSGGSDSTSFAESADHVWRPAVQKTAHELKNKDQQCRVSLKPSTGGILSDKVSNRRCEPTHSYQECNCGADKPPKSRWQGQPARALSDTISKTLKKVSKRCKQPDLDLCSRPKSAPLDQSPFVQYGRGDDEAETGAKRTYNVLSHQGVYESAHDAKQHLVTAKELKRKERQSRQPRQPSGSRNTVLCDAQFEDKMKKETTKWQTEYNKRYCQFPVSRYHWRV